MTAARGLGAIVARAGALSLGVAVCVAAGGVGPSAARASEPPAQLRAFACVRAVDPLERGVTVLAVMRPVRGTQRLELRFQLLHAASRHGRFRNVRGANLGRWFSPADPTLGRRPGDVWAVRHPVVGLAAPGLYRLRISFRWIGTGGTLAHQALLTPVCQEPDLGPDLAVGAIAIAPVAGGPGRDRYVAVVRDLGDTGAGPFDVALLESGSLAGLRRVAWLGPGRARRIVFVAPACTAGASVTVTADPRRQVPDATRVNDSRTVRCPALH